jgi:hypothetical protein
MTSVTICLMSAADEDIQSWISFADADMAAAEGLHNLGLDANALFHLQQAVEKTLKAVLLKKTGSAPPQSARAGRAVRIQFDFGPEAIP